MTIKQQQTSMTTLRQQRRSARPAVSAITAVATVALLAVMLGLPAWGPTALLAAAPSATNIGKYLVIAMGDDANIGRAFQMSNTEIGADRKILSTANDPGYVTDGGFPNLLGVFGTRWKTSTNPDSIDNAATLFQDVDWSGEVALTSDNGKFDSSNSLVFADTGIQSVHSNPLSSVSNTKYFDVGQSAAPGSNIAIGNGVTTGNNYTTLLSELSAWKTFILGLSAETSITNQSSWTNNAASNGSGGLLTTYSDALDTNNDGIIVVDFSISPSSKMAM